MNISRFFQNSLVILCLIPIECTCAGKGNKYGEGSECKEYGGYEDDWYNGRWCYADVKTCPDAKAHPASASQNIPGYGASKVACGEGNSYICTRAQRIESNIWHVSIVPFYHYQLFLN